MEKMKSVVNDNYCVVRYFDSCYDKLHSKKYLSEDHAKEILKESSNIK